MALDGGAQSLRAGLSAAGGISFIGRPPQVLEAALRRIGQNAGRPGARRGDLQEGAPGISSDRRDDDRRDCGAAESLESEVDCQSTNDGARSYARRDYVRSVF